jgi:hypothetical protein
VSDSDKNQEYLTMHRDMKTGNHFAGTDTDEKLTLNSTDM